MATVHVIAPGDWLDALARRYGIGQPAQIWEHPRNAELRVRRGTPDLLMVGDRLFIPDGARARCVLATGRRHVLRVSAPRTVLRVRVPDLGPMIAAFGPIDYELRAGGVASRGTLTGGDEVLELVLPPTVRQAVLLLRGLIVLSFAIGGLGPVDEPRGALARLQNLGLVGDEMASAREGVGDPLVTALRRFQRTRGLPVTGELDEATQAALVAAYGA